MDKSSGLASAIEALDLEAGGILAVTCVQVLEWGRELRLDCVYRLGDSETRLAIRFRDCREMRWRVYVHGDVTDESAVAELRLGRDGHRSPAQVLTEHLGVSVVYGELAISR